MVVYLFYITKLCYLPCLHDVNNGNSHKQIMIFKNTVLYNHLRVILNYLHDFIRKNDIIYISFT